MIEELIKVKIEYEWHEIKDELVRANDNGGMEGEDMFKAIIKAYTG